MSNIAGWQKAFTHNDDLASGAEGRPLGERPVQPDHYQFWPAHLPREMPLPETSLYRNLEATAARFPDKPVVQYYG
ncbi:MAG TPA: hypothetical protein VN496_14095, partial [Burkholderiales bacterium]|nr:hypothetical protein [Burkholderiales bacterium]